MPGSGSERRRPRSPGLPTVATALIHTRCSSLSPWLTLRRRVERCYRIGSHACPTRNPSAGDGSPNCSWRLASSVAVHSKVTAKVIHAVLTTSGPGRGAARQTLKVWSAKWSARAKKEAVWIARRQSRTCASHQLRRSCGTHR